MEYKANQNLMMFQKAQIATEVISLYNTLEEGQLQDITLSDYSMQLDLNAGKLDYNGNVLLQHYGGERNMLVGYESTPDGNCFFNSLSFVLYGDESHSYQLRYLLMVFIVKNYDSLLLDNPTVSLPN